MNFMNILICEDDVHMRDMISEMFESVGHKVETSSDGEEALRKILAGSKSFDLLITDNNMPRLSGMELVEMVRRLGFQMKVIMASGFATPLDPKIQKRLLPDRILVKPFKMDDLLKTVDQLCETMENKNN